MQHYPALLKLFLDTQYQHVKIDEFTANKLQQFNIVLQSFGYAALHQQQQFYHDFGADFSNYSQKQQRHHSHQRASPHQHTPIAASYELLGLNMSASKQETKQAYRRLMSQHHPDKLMAKKASAAEIKLANEKTQAIGKAYQKICAFKGW